MGGRPGVVEGAGRVIVVVASMGGGAMASMAAGSMTLPCWRRGGDDGGFSIAGGAMGAGGLRGGVGIRSHIEGAGGGDIAQRRWAAVALPKFFPPKNNRPERRVGEC